MGRGSGIRIPIHFTTPNLATVAGQLNRLTRAQSGLQQIGRIVTQYVGFRAVLRKVTSSIRDAITTIKDLDKTITNIAVVTNMTQEQLWGRMGQYMQMANQYGVAVNNVYTVSQLFYQQGLQTSQVMSMTNETLKMAKIAGMDYAEAADAMTVAVRAFNIEMANAQNVTDVYSSLAANFAVSSQEIANAMEKTASSAASVGMSLESTSAFMSVMIQTTRESAENIGSAMKSIISRYGEMKASPNTLLNVDGEEVAYNKVDTALKSIGISIKDAKGQFRDFDDVIMELAGKWNTLDNNTQRYIATIMAGNRQQSRFIALVSNTSELNRALDTANNSQNASLQQVLKTMNSIETKAQQMKSAWTDLYAGLGFEEKIKSFYDTVTQVLKNIKKQGVITLGTLAVQITSLSTNLKTMASTFTGMTLGGLGTFTSPVTGQRYRGSYQQAYAMGAQSSFTAYKNQKAIGVAATASAIGNAIGTYITTKGLTIKDSSKGGSEKSKIVTGVGQLASGAANTAGAVAAFYSGNWGLAISQGLQAVTNYVSGFVKIIDGLDYKNIEKYQNALEELQDAQDKYTQAQAKTQDLESQIKKIKQLQSSAYNSEEDLQTYQEAMNNLADTYPSLISAYDASGNAIVSLVDAEKNLASLREQEARSSEQLARKEIQAKVTEIAALEDTLGEASTNAASSHLLLGTTYYTPYSVKYDSTNGQIFMNGAQKGGFIGYGLNAAFHGTSLDTKGQVADYFKAYDEDETVSKLVANGVISSLETFAGFSSEDIENGTHSTQEAVAAIENWRNYIQGVIDGDRKAVEEAYKTLAESIGSETLVSLYNGGTFKSEAKEIIATSDSVNGLISRAMEVELQKQRQAGHNYTSLTDWYTKNSTSYEAVTKQVATYIGSSLDSLGFTEDQMSSFLGDIGNLTQYKNINELFSEYNITPTTELEDALRQEWVTQNINAREILFGQIYDTSTTNKNTGFISGQGLNSNLASDLTTNQAFKDLKTNATQWFDNADQIITPYALALSGQIGKINSLFKSGYRGQAEMQATSVKEVYATLVDLNSDIQSAMYSTVSGITYNSRESITNAIKAFEDYKTNNADNLTAADKAAIDATINALHDAYGRIVGNIIVSYQSYAQEIASTAETRSTRLNTAASGQDLDKALTEFNKLILDSNYTNFSFDEVYVFDAALGKYVYTVKGLGALMEKEARDLEEKQTQAQDDQKQYINFIQSLASIPQNFRQIFQFDKNGKYIFNAADFGGDADAALMFETYYNMYLSSLDNINKATEQGFVDYMTTYGQQVQTAVAQANSEREAFDASTIHTLVSSIKWGDLAKGINANGNKANMSQLYEQINGNLLAFDSWYDSFLAAGVEQKAQMFKNMTAVAVTKGKLDESEVTSTMNTMFKEAESAMTTAMSEMLQGNGAILSDSTVAMLNAAGLGHLVKDGRLVVTSAQELNDAASKMLNTYGENFLTIATAIEEWEKAFNAKYSGGSNILSGLKSATSATADVLGKLFQSFNLNPNDFQYSNGTWAFTQITTNAFGETVIKDWDSLLDEMYDQAVGRGAIDKTKFSLEAYKNTKEYRMAYSEYLDSYEKWQIEEHTAAIKQLDSFAGAKKGDKINLSLLATTFGDGLNDILLKYGIKVVDGFAEVTDEADVWGFLNEFSNDPAIKNGPKELQDAVTAVADTLLKTIQSYEKALENGYSGTLSYADKDILQRKFGLDDRYFKETANGWKITKEGIALASDELYRYDALSGQVFRKYLSDQRKELDGWRSIVEVEQTIIDLQEKMSALPTSDSRYQMYKREYEEAVKIYHMRSRTDADSWKLFNDNMSEARQGALNLWESAYNAMDKLDDVMGTGGSTGKGGVTASEWRVFAQGLEESGQLEEFAQKFNQTWTTAADMITDGQEHMKRAADGSTDTVVDFSHFFGDNIASAVTELKTDSTTFIKALAKQQIEIIDAEIDMLKGIALMEDLNMDSNNDGSLGLSEIFKNESDELLESSKQILKSFVESEKNMTALEKIWVNFGKGNFKLSEVFTGLAEGKDWREYFTKLEDYQSFMQSYFDGLFKLDFSEGLEDIESQLASVFSPIGMYYDENLHEWILGVKVDGTVKNETDDKAGDSSSGTGGDSGEEAGTPKLYNMQINCNVAGDTDKAIALLQAAGVVATVDGNGTVGQGNITLTGTTGITYTASVTNGVLTLSGMAGSTPWSWTPPADGETGGATLAATIRQAWQDDYNANQTQINNTLGDNASYTANATLTGGTQVSYNYTVSKDGTINPSIDGLKGPYPDIASANAAVVDYINSQYSTLGNIQNAMITLGTNGMTVTKTQKLPGGVNVVTDFTIDKNGTVTGPNGQTYSTLTDAETVVQDELKDNYNNLKDFENTVLSYKNGVLAVSEDIDAGDGTTVHASFTINKDGTINGINAVKGTSQKYKTLDDAITAASAYVTVHRNEFDNFKNTLGEYEVQFGEDGTKITTTLDVGDGVTIDTSFKIEIKNDGLYVNNEPVSDFAGKIDEIVQTYNDNKAIFDSLGSRLGYDSSTGSFFSLFSKKKWKKPITLPNGQKVVATFEVTEDDKYLYNGTEYKDMNELQGAVQNSITNFIANSGLSADVFEGADFESDEDGNLTATLNQKVATTYGIGDVYTITQDVNSGEYKAANKDNETIDYNTVKNTVATTIKNKLDFWANFFAGLGSTKTQTIDNKLIITYDDSVEVRDINGNTLKTYTGLNAEEQARLDIENGVFGTSIIITKSDGSGEDNDFSVPPITLGDEVEPPPKKEEEIPFVLETPPEEFTSVKADKIKIRKDDDGGYETLGAQDENKATALRIFGRTPTENSTEEALSEWTKRFYNEELIEAQVRESSSDDKDAARAYYIVQAMNAAGVMNGEDYYNIIDTANGRVNWGELLEWYKNYIELTQGLAPVIEVVNEAIDNKKNPKAESLTSLAQWYLGGDDEGKIRKTEDGKIDRSNIDEDDTIAPIIADAYDYVTEMEATLAEMEASGASSEEIANYLNDAVMALGGMKDTIGNAESGFDKVMTALINALQTKITQINNLTVTSNGESSSAKGNIAFAQGNALAQGTLMGELGPELVVTNGRYFIAGQNGAEFVDLPSDAIVFNHLQTASLMSNGHASRGRAVNGTNAALAMATGNWNGGPAHASASETIKALEDLRSIWQGLLNASASDLAKKGSGGGDSTVKAVLADLERWYNLLRQISRAEAEVTYEQQKRNNMKSGTDYIKSLQYELSLLEKEQVTYKKLADAQKSYYDAKTKELNTSAYSMFYTYDETGLMQYRDANYHILEELYAVDENGKAKLNADQQVALLKKYGFDTSVLQYNAEGEKSKDSEAMMNVFKDSFDGYQEELDSIYDSYHGYLEKVEKTLEEQNKILEEYREIQINTENLILKAIEDREQATIDKLQEQYDILSKTAQDYVSGLSKALTKEKEMYSKNETEKELTQLQRQLAILQRSGGSASAIKSLQDQIDSQLQESYFTEREDEIDAIQEASDAQLEKLQKQIDILTESLEYQKNNGLLWNEVDEILKKGSPEAIQQFLTEYSSTYKNLSATGLQKQMSDDLKLIEKYVALMTDKDVYGFNEWYEGANLKEETSKLAGGAQAWEARGDDLVQAQAKSAYLKALNEGKTKGEAQELATEAVYKYLQLDKDSTSHVATEGQGGSGSGSGGGSGSGNGNEKYYWYVNKSGEVMYALKKWAEDNSKDDYDIKEKTSDTKPSAESLKKTTATTAEKAAAQKEYNNAVAASRTATQAYQNKMNIKQYGDSIGLKRNDPELTTEYNNYVKNLETAMNTAQEKAHEAYKKLQAYSEGGDVDYTGLAMVHGSKSHPEAFISAADRELMKSSIFSSNAKNVVNAFQQFLNIADKLATNNGDGATSNTGITIESLSINLDSGIISSDYDAQRAAQTVMDEIVKVARQTTNLSLSRR